MKCAPDCQPPEGFRVREVPAATWLKAECDGPLPEQIQALWHELVTGFFPTSQYRPTGKVNLEVYPADMNPDDPDYRCEIWVSVVKE